MDKKKETTMEKERIYFECIVLFIDALEKMSNCSFE
jgi:hypothetical protein